MASSSLTAVAASQQGGYGGAKDEQKPFLEQLLREGVTEDGSKELLGVVDGYRKKRPILA